MIKSWVILYQLEDEFSVDGIDYITGITALPASIGSEGA